MSHFAVDLCVAFRRLDDISLGHASVLDNEVRREESRRAGERATPPPHRTVFWVCNLLYCCNSLFEKQVEANLLTMLDSGCF